MQYHEQPLKDGVQYKTTNVYGVMTITSPHALKVDTLDNYVFAIARQGEQRGELPDGVTYTFEPADTINDLEVFDLIPNLKETISLEQLITAIVASMGSKQHKRLLAHLKEHNFLVD